MDQRTQRGAARLELLAPAALCLALLAWALWPWLPIGRASKHPRTIVFYGFSILGEVLTGAVFPAFEKHWKNETGESLEVIGSFAGSGTITNQMILGVPAQLALLSLEGDALRLEKAGVIGPASW